MFKKITISLMLVLTLLFTCLPISALADETTTASTAAEEETVDVTTTADQEDHKEDATPAESAEAAEEGESSVNEDGLISVYTEDGEEETTKKPLARYENYSSTFIINVPEGFTDEIRILFEKEGTEEVTVLTFTPENDYTQTIYMKALEAFHATLLNKDAKLYSSNMRSVAGKLVWLQSSYEFTGTTAIGDTAARTERLFFVPTELESESESESAVLTIGSETEGEPVTETKNTNPFLNFLSGFGSFILNNLVLLLIIAGGFGYLVYRKKKYKAEIKETIEEDKKDDTYIE